MKIPYPGRIKKVQKVLKKSDGSSALLISSARPQPRSRDTYYPFRQDSNFFYLTGSYIQNTALLIRENDCILFTHPVDPVHVLWEGKPIDAHALALSLGAEITLSKNLEQAVMQQCSMCDTLFFQNDAGSLGWDIARQLLKVNSAYRRSGPVHFHHIDTILAPLRLVKDSTEVRAIEQAITVTYESLKGIMPVLLRGTSEKALADLLIYRMSLFRAIPSFPTIAASGKSAATLHYEKLAQVLKNKDLFLLDFGAELDMYAGDITRVFPVSGQFSGWQADLYDIVLAAQKAALRRIKPGVKIHSIYAAAARILTQGLVELKVLRGNPKELYKKGAFRSFFPHGIGHSLGIDVHDIGGLRGNNNARLEKGMVFTIEPGLYFPKKIGNVPPSGVRIEDDILVTNDGYKNLSAQIPKERDEIESFMATYR